MNKLAFYEIPAKKPEVIKRFYTKVLGWKYSRWGKEPYWMIEEGQDKSAIPAGVYLSEKLKGVVPTFSVPDLEKAVKSARDGGGKVFMTTDEGRHIYLKDPEGTIFGIWQAEK